MNVQAMDHGDSGSSQPDVMDVIASTKIKHDVRRIPVPALRHHAPDIDLIDLLSDHARRFAESLADRPNVRRVAVPDFLARARCEGTLSKPIGWTNHIFAGPDFRWAHVEFFSIPDQIGVIHVCVFSGLDRDAPIFGFDIIAGRKKATGAFLDLSPTTLAADALIEAWAGATAAERAAFSEHRDLPGWASDIFSSHALAIRPVSDDEVARALDFGHRSLAMMLDAGAGQSRSVPAMAEAQMRYVEGQRRNEHTFRMLANCIGPSLARDFIDGWLFPSTDGCFLRRFDARQTGQERHGSHHTAGLDRIGSLAAPPVTVVHPGHGESLDGACRHNLARAIPPFVPRERARHRSDATEEPKDQTLTPPAASRKSGAVSKHHI